MKEIRSMALLAAPMVAMQLGLILFGVVDMMYVGRIGATELAAVGLAHGTIFGLFCFGIGCTLGIDTLSSRAFGAGKLDECVRVHFHSCLLALIVGLPLIGLLFFADHFYALIGVEPAVRALATDFLTLGRWTILPGMLFTVARQTLQAIEWTRPLLIIMAAANLVNAALGYCIVLGNFGFPRLGVRGCAIATFIAHWLMLGLVMIYVRELYGRAGINRKLIRFDGALLRSLFRLGLPAGAQFFMEVSVFSLATAVMSKFGATIAAAHQVTLNMAGTAFMVPMGISYAAAVRVGQGIGRSDPEASRRAGNKALILGVVFACCSSAAFALVPEFFLRLYTNEAAVIEYGAKLMVLVAIFQLFDGIQVVCGGALRGLGQTAITMHANLVGHWCIGFPLGLYFAFKRDMQAVGLWIGLCSGLISVATLLFWRWRVLSAQEIKPRR